MILKAAWVRFAIAPGSIDGRILLAPEPKEMLLLDGSGHAQFLFTTDQNEPLMKAILRFLAAASAVHR